MTETPARDSVPDDVGEAFGRYYEKALLFGITSDEAENYKMQIQQKHGNGADVTARIHRMQLLVRRVQPDGLGR